VSASNVDGCNVGEAEEEDGKEEEAEEEELEAITVSKSSWMVPITGEVGLSA
jgi:hypothetical protein